MTIRPSVRFFSAFVLSIFCLSACLGVHADDNSDAATLTATRAQLEAQLQQIQAEINADQSQISTLQGQSNTLSNKLSQLVTQQSALKLQIQATDLKIDDVNSRLADTNTSIATNEQSLSDLRQHLSDLLDAMNQLDGQPLVFQAVLNDDGLSTALDEYEQYSELSSSLNTASAQAATLATTLDGQRDTLTAAQIEAQNDLSIKTLQVAQLADAEQSQAQILADTKGKESVYQASLATSKQQAAAIQSRIYQLLGETSQITFGQAVTIAEWAQGATGTPAALLLAILTQESNLGSNVGTCNRPGDPPSKSWRVVMKPDRDQQPFLQITSSLGRNPDITPISCPMHDANGQQLGWGGAMGPAQFIPSTWVGYISKIAALAGGPAVPDPWDIRDAFAASAIKLKADGADGTDTGDWDAAMRYFSGGTNPAYSFYGDSVLAQEKKYRADITTLSN